MFSQVFSFFEWNFAGLLDEKTRQGSENYNLNNRRIVLSKSVFVRKLKLSKFFGNFSEIRRNIFRSLGEVFRRRLSKLHFTGLEKLFEGFYFEVRIKFLNFQRTLGETFLECVQIFWHGCQNCIVSVRRMILNKNFVFRQLFLWNYSSIIGKTFLSVVGIFPSVLSKLLFTSWQEVFEEVLLRESFFCLAFLTMGEGGMIVKTSWCVPGGTLRGKILFFSSELVLLIYSQVLGEMFLKFGNKSLPSLSTYTSRYVPSTYTENRFQQFAFSEKNI